MIVIQFTEPETELNMKAKPIKFLIAKPDLTEHLINGILAIMAIFSFLFD